MTDDMFKRDLKKQLRQHNAALLYVSNVTVSIVISERDSTPFCRISVSDAFLKKH